MTGDAIIDMAPVFVQAHGPALAAVLPLLAAALAAVIPSARGAWAIALGTCVAVTFVAAVMLALVWTATPLSYPMGGFEPPLGIEYRIDRLNAAFVLLVAVMAVLCLVYAPESVRGEVPEPKQALFYSAFLVCVAGLIGVAATGDAFNLFV
ncbi:MAG: hypothetical protein MI723_12105, partial [Caulobacterales bacterium]|nr:hypothetical protein [Caulobacterales bacterium]